MTEDNIYQVVYECCICGRTKQIDDTSLKAISQEFKKLGWGNVPEYHHGKTEYTEYCPKCYRGVFKYDETDAFMLDRAEMDLDEQVADFDEQQETYDDFLAGTGRV